MVDHVAGVTCADAFVNERAVVLVEREVLVHGLIDEETSRTLSIGGDGVQRGCLLLRDAEVQLLEGHARRILADDSQVSFGSYGPGFFSP